MVSMRTRLSLLVLAATLLSGCVIDHTGRSGSFILQSRMDTMRDKNRDLEKDLARERARVDRIEQRASEARRRYADAGASVQALMEDLAHLRGDVASVKDQLGRSGTLSDDMDFRLSSLEGQLVHVEDALVAGMDGYKLAPVVMPEEKAVEKPATKSSSQEEAAAGSDESAEGVSEESSGGAASPASASKSDSSEAAVSEPSGTEESSEQEEESATTEQSVPKEPTVDEVLFREGRKLYDQGKWRDAGRRFLKIRKKHSDSVHALEAQFLLSMCLYELGRYKDALSEFQRVVDSRGSTELSAHSMYMQGMSFIKLGTSEDLEAAEIFFVDVMTDWPKTSWAKKAEKQLGKMNAN
jgi:TolA-binding protein